MCGGGGGPERRWMGTEDTKGLEHWLSLPQQTMELTAVINGVPDSRTSTSYDAWPVTAA